MKKKMKLALVLALSFVVVFAATMMPRTARATTYNYIYDGVVCDKGNTVKLETDMDLNSAIYAKNGQTLNYRISTTDGSTFGEFSTLVTPNYKVYPTTYGKTSFEGTINLDTIGEYSFDISGGVNDDYEFTIANVHAVTPTKLKIYSTPNRIYFNKKSVDTNLCGQDIYIKRLDNSKVYVHDSTNDAIYIAGFSPNKKYKFEIRSGNMKGTTLTGASKAMNKTVPTGPSVKPVIKSVKVTNFKVKKFWSTTKLKYMYTSSYTVNVTLSKKASGTKGAVVMLGNGATKTIKGTGKTFKMGYNSTTDHSEKNTRMGVKVMTYSNSTYMCYSYESKVKKITVK